MPKEKSDSSGAMPLTVAAAFAGTYMRRNRAMTLRSTHPNPVIAAGSDLFVVRVEISISGA
jgi:hypothetical protein